jgi:hypothetical protein
MVPLLALAPTNHVYCTVIPVSSPALHVCALARPWLHPSPCHLRAKAAWGLDA